jgi:hypothetical protein
LLHVATFSLKCIEHQNAVFPLSTKGPEAGNWKAIGAAPATIEYPQQSCWHVRLFDLRGHVCVCVKGL